MHTTIVPQRKETKMNRRRCHLVFLVAIAASVATPPSISTSAEQAPKKYPDPARFESAISQFEKQDHISAPPADVIVCVGSSSMRKWHDTIHQDLEPLTIIARGFGGSNMNDLLHFLNRVVLVYKPRAVVIYEGDNDTAAGIPPAEIARKFHEVVAKIRAALPDARIYFLAIKPSVKRWNLWPRMKQANERIAAQCARDPQLTFVDVATPMMATNGKVKPDIFAKDNLHMNRKGYEIWRDVLRPILLTTEGPHEQRRPAPRQP